MSDSKYGSQIRIISKQNQDSLKKNKIHKDLLIYSKNIQICSVLIKCPKIMINGRFDAMVL